METQNGFKVQIKDQAEIEIQRTIMKLLARHPAIGWAKRMNVGGAYLKGRWVEFAFAGCSDIIGQLRTGEFFACEVKRPGVQATVEQGEFIGKVNSFHGMAVIASSTEDVNNWLNAWVRRRRSPREFAGAFTKPSNRGSKRGKIGKDDI